MNISKYKGFGNYIVNVYLCVSFIFLYHILSQQKTSFCACAFVLCASLDPCCDVSRAAPHLEPRNEMTSHGDVTKQLNNLTRFLYVKSLIATQLHTTDWFVSHYCVRYHDPELRTDEQSERIPVFDLC